MKRPSNETIQEERDVILDSVYWSRQIVALTCGLIWGFFGIVGSFGLITFALANTLFVYIYTTKYHLNYDILTDAIKEGFMSALSVFMVSWITSYSVAYF